MTAAGGPAAELGAGRPATTILPETPVGEPAVPRLELVEWAARFGIVAGITTGQNGFSLGLWSDEPAGQVMTRWRAFRRAMAAGFPAVVLSNQVHGSGLHWLEDVPPGWLLLDGVDGHITRQAGALLTITIADCVPVYLANPDASVVALLHAGWRGIAGGILERAVDRLTTVIGVRGADLVMHCGVAICGSCYEVSSEVAFQLTGRPVEGERGHIDLRHLLAHRALALGIGDVTISSFCTAHHHDRFFSHRASGGTDGRMVAYLGMPQGGRLPRP